MLILIMAIFAFINNTKTFTKMKRFKQFWVSLGVASFLSSFLMMVYDLTTTYSQVFPTEMGVIIPIVLFFAVSVVYFLGNFMYIYLAKIFDRIHLYMRFANEHSSVYKYKEKTKYEEKIAIEASEREV